MKTLDFLIIGAQKSATTTLFEHLRQHPDIHMPLEKEVPFFTDAACDEQDWEAFSSRYLGDADDPRLWAKATPQYMCDPEVPARIKALMPDTKLVAIVRDPLQRAWSHYRMGLRRNTETLPFADRVSDLLTPQALQRGRTLPPPGHQNEPESEADFYLAWSEYGRIISTYMQHFDREQLLVLYTEDLEADPAGTLDRLSGFLGLDTGYRPPSLGKVMHRGGSKTRVPNSVRTWLREYTPLFWLWQQLSPQRRGRLRFLYEQWNVQSGAEETLQLPATLETELRQHFAADLQALFDWTDNRPSWAPDYTGA